MESGVRVVPSDQAKMRFIDVEPSTDFEYNYDEDGNLVVDATKPVWVIYATMKDYTPKIMGIVFCEADAKGMISAIKNNLNPTMARQFAMGSDRRAIADYIKTQFQLPPDELEQIIAIKKSVIEQEPERESSGRRRGKK